jgi:hypothetical protein
MSLEAFLPVLSALKYANGAYAIVACAAVGVLLVPRAWRLPAVPVAGLVAPAAFAALCLFALAYALFPNYLDHAEPAMTQLGFALLEGRPLYPALDAYTFHGLLYGPLVAELQAAAILAGSSLAGLPVILASKLSGVLAFLAASLLFFRLASGWKFARAYYVLFVLPFGYWAIWNRCEPLFLLLAAGGLWAAALRPRRQALLLIGLCAGLASGLKLHGCLYLAPAVLMVIVRSGLAADALLVPAIPALAAFLLLFLPENVSLAAYFEYLARAATHGLSGELLLTNLFFLGALWSPLVVARPGALREPELLALAALQLGVAVIGSKPGAGIHHLLPFIPANALFFARHVDAGAMRHAASFLVWLAMLLPGIAVLAWQSLAMERGWRAYAGAARELASIQSAYPGVVMGAGGSSFYPYTFLRPMLERHGPPQVEYSSFMDLHLIGVSDGPLREAFERCAIAQLAVPRREPPFTLASYYAAGTPMFSAGLRASFARRFVKVAEGNWYDVYRCTKE